LQQEDCSRFPDTPYCLGGECTDCSAPGGDDFCLTFQAVCDADTKRCRDCRSNHECPSDACANGNCLDEADVLYVAPGGAPDSACTRDAPCGTVAHAIEFIGEHSAISLAAGTYSEALDLSALPWIYIVGDGDATITPPASGIPVVALETGIAFERVTLSGASGTGGDGIRCTSTSDGAQVTLTDVTISGNDGAGITASQCGLTLYRTNISSNGADGVDVTGSFVWLEGCHVEDNGGVGVRALDVGTDGIGIPADVATTWIQRNHGGGFEFRGSGLIYSSMIVDNGNASDAQVGGLSIDNAGPLSQSGADAELFNVTVARNIVAAADRSAGIHCTAPSGMYNLIVWDNAGGNGPIGDACDVTYSLLFPGPTPAGVGNLTGDPAFIAPDDDNFDIGATSDAIDRGNPSGLDSLDIHGDVRGGGALNDLGADEYTAP
jgi:hypothetical protein